MEEGTARENHRDGSGRKARLYVAGFTDAGGAVSQGMQAASGSWKKHGNGFSPRAPARNSVLPTPDFSQVKPNPFWTAELHNYKLINLCCFKPLNL